MTLDIVFFFFFKFCFEGHHGFGPNLNYLSVPFCVVFSTTLVLYYIGWFKCSSSSTNVHVDVHMFEDSFQALELYTHIYMDTNVTSCKHIAVAFLYKCSCSSCTYVHVQFMLMYTWGLTSGSRAIYTRLKFMFRCSNVHLQIFKCRCSNAYVQLFMYGTHYTYICSNVHVQVFIYEWSC